MSPDLTIENRRRCSSVHYSREFASSRDPGVTYLTTVDRCTCPGFEKRGGLEGSGAVCRHMKEMRTFVCGWDEELAPNGIGGDPHAAGRVGRPANLMGPCDDGEEPCPLCGAPLEFYQVAV